MQSMKSCQCWKETNSREKISGRCRPKASKRCAMLACSGQSKPVNGVDWKFILSNGSRVWFVSPKRALPVDGLHRILGGHAWYTCLYPQRAQEDIWSKNPDARVASSFAPTGKVTREGDGFRLRGRWKYLSGVDHSEWAILGGIIPDDGTGPEMRNFLVPMTDYKIDQSSWHVEGLQGTGSKDIDVDAFVPDYRTQTVEQVYKGIEPGKSVNKSPLFQIPWFTMWSYEALSTAIGAALGALQAYVDDNRSRTSALLGTNVAGNFYVHTRLVEAATAINDVKARIPVIWNHIYDLVKSGAPISNELRIKTRFEGAYADQVLPGGGHQAAGGEWRRGFGEGQGGTASRAQSHGHETASILDMGKHGGALFFSSVWTSVRGPIHESSYRMCAFDGWTRMRATRADRE